MADHIIHLPQDFQYVYQFEAGKSQYRCVAAVLSMCAQIAYPGRWQSPSDLMHAIYEHYTGQPDIPSNMDGMTKEQCIDWFISNHVGYLDLQPLLADTAELRKEVQAQNKQNVAQLITVADESHLKYAKNGEKLHNWVDTGLHHCILRVGFSDDQGYGLYEEPAAGLAFPHPVPINWSDIEAAGIMTCIAVMPHAVSQPPAGFRYYGGDGQPDHLWPEPAPVINTENAASTIHAMIAALDNLGQAVATLKGAAQNVLSDIGKS